MIELKTVKEALDFIDSFDGYGMISEDEDLQIEKLLNYDLIDDYTPEARKEYEYHLKSHEDWEEIELQILSDYNSDGVEYLDYFTLKALAGDYGY